MLLWIFIASFSVGTSLYDTMLAYLLTEYAFAGFFLIKS